MPTIAEEARKRWADNNMYSGKPVRAKITACPNKDHWHIDSIGKYIWVIYVNWASAYMEAENGCSIPKSDIKLLKLKQNENQKQH